MKVKIGPYVGLHTTSFHENYMEAKYGNRFADSSDSLDYYVEVVDATIQWVYDHTINLYLNKKERSVKVHIHKYTHFYLVKQEKLCSKCEHFTQLLSVIHQTHNTL